MNDEISRDFDSLEYVAIDDVMIALILRDVDVVMLKENLVDVFKHVLVIMSNR